MHAARLLIVEDSPSLALTYQAFLAEGKHGAVIAGTLAEAESMMESGIFSAILLDVHLPDGSGIDFLAALRARGNTIPVVVMTLDSPVDMAVEAMRRGAQDFISKPVTPERLNLTVRNILENRALKKIVDQYQETERESFCGFVGKSPAMQVVYRILEQAAQSRAPVFITGESGTGKELAARAIHELSSRKFGPFEALNCAAIPGALLESEVFGHARGAFTGAVSAHKGAAERAHQGTLMLDELGEMPMELQAKMLRFTQSSLFRPLGGAKEVQADVRFVSATNKNPLESVKRGSLREDLYYRLNVIPVHLPPLRERGEDVLRIARSLLISMAREEGKKFLRIAKDAEDFLLSHAWPGNVRELQNVLRRAIVLHEGEALTADMLAREERGFAAADKVALMPLHEVERKTIEWAISVCGGNITEAAKKLEINPSTLHRKLKQWKSS